MKRLAFVFFVFVLALACAHRVPLPDPAPPDEPLVPTPLIPAPPDTEASEAMVAGPTDYARQERAQREPPPPPPKPAAPPKATARSRTALAMAGAGGATMEMDLDGARVRLTCPPQTPCPPVVTCTQPDPSPIIAASLQGPDTALRHEIKSDAARKTSDLLMEILKPGAGVLGGVLATLMSRRFLKREG